MLKTERNVYVIFTCHMAIEKLLKAIVAEVTDKLPPKTHNLIYLTKLANLNIPEELFDFIAKINNAIVVTRYPEDFKRLMEDYPKDVVKNILKTQRRCFNG